MLITEVTETNRAPPPCKLSLNSRTFDTPRETNNVPVDFISWWEDGGHVPHLDHLVSPDIPYGHYCEYLEKKRKVIGR